MSDIEPVMPSTLLRESLWRRLLQALGYALLTTFILLAVIFLLSGPSQRERRTTARNVTRLVDEAHKNREVLCIAVIRNPLNSARDDPRLLELCEEIGVTP